MRVLLYFSLVQFALCIIRLPGQKVDKDTLTTLGIKTLDWQGEEEQSSASQIHVHHNYSKVSVQKQVDGQKTVDGDDYFDSTGQTNLFGAQQLEDDDQIGQGPFQGQEEGGFSQTQTDWFGGQQVDYDLSSYDNEKIYNAHGYGNRLELDQVMEAENLQNQQFEEFPDYETGQLQLVDQAAEGSAPEEREAKHFYPVNKPMYIHGFKYPPEENVNGGNHPPEVHKECPKMATGQFVHPASCNQFLNCWKGRGYVQNCAPGTLFNPKTLECDFAAKVKCLTGPRRPEKNQPLGGELKISCPAGFSGVVPHHSDCAKFINCANGVENVMDCPPGTLFNLKINNCDFPYKSECASWSVEFGNYSGQNFQGSHQFGYNQGSWGAHGYGQGASSGSQQANQGYYGSGSVNQQTQTGYGNREHYYGQNQNGNQGGAGNQGYVQNYGQNHGNLEGGEGYYAHGNQNQGFYGSGGASAKGEGQNQNSNQKVSGNWGYGQNQGNFRGAHGHNQQNLDERQNFHHGQGENQHKTPTRYVQA